jgi:mono/diheme cytochrome c family protein
MALGYSFKNKNHQKMKIKISLFLSLLCPLFLLAQEDTTQQAIDFEVIKTMNGRQIYETFCAKCHGIDGKGNIPEEIKQNWDVPPPDFTDGYFNTREPRKDWYAVIKYGGPVRGLSQTMPAFGDVFSDEQIYDVIEHIKSFVDQKKYPQGELNFIRAHYVTKAYVEQEALLIPTYTKFENGHNVSDTKVLLYYANRFATRFQYEVKLPVQNLKSCVQNTTGIGDLELGLKYAFYDNYKNLSILTAGFEFSLPTGSEAKGFGKGTVVIVPYIAGAKGIGEKIELQGSVKIEAPVNKSKGNPELIYAISSTLILPEGRRGIFPGVELLGTKNLGSSEHTISLVPKIYIALTRRGHLAISIGREIPIYGGTPFKYRYIGFILWDYIDGSIFSGW